MRTLQQLNNFITYFIFCKYNLNSQVFFYLFFFWKKSICTIYIIIINKLLTHTKFLKYFKNVYKVFIYQLTIRQKNIITECQSEMYVTDRRRRGRAHK